jgi:phospholipid-binding lipoprotein MlaA
MRILVLTFLLAIALPFSAQAQDADRQYEVGYSDPAEGINRGIFTFNSAVDEYVFDPIISGYRFAVPKEGRQAITNFLRNLKTPVNLTNQLLQGDLNGAGVTLFRFVTNTLTGFGGFLDNAGREGWAYEREDLGQTLAVWGVGDGPYVVMPFFGTASLRDAVGYGLDSLLDPINHINDDGVRYAYNGTLFLEQKNQLFDVSNDLRANSLDPYSAMKSAVYQNRQAEIADRNTTNKKRTETISESNAFAIPDYDGDF